MTRAFEMVEYVEHFSVFFFCYCLLVEGELSSTRFCINKHIISVVENIVMEIAIVRWRTIFFFRGKLNALKSICINENRPKTRASH